MPLSTIDVLKSLHSSRWDRRVTRTLLHSSFVHEKMNLRTFSVFLLIVSFTVEVPAQQVRYRDKIFDSCQLKSDIRYGIHPENVLDLYLPPTTDTVVSRPLVMFIHGGGFKNPTQTKVGSFQARICTSFVQRGYVAASINYRLTPVIPNDAAYFEAMLRALQDAEAAIRFCRKDATVYGINPSFTAAIGSSAGSIIALHLAYLDSAEVPRYVRWENVGGSFDEGSNSLKNDARLQAVVNCWGALGDTSWMDKSAVPVYSIHGTEDRTVKYDSIPAYKAFIFGSSHIYAAARHRKINTDLRPFLNTGHTLDNNAAKQDSAVADISRWLFENFHAQLSAH